MFFLQQEDHAGGLGVEGTGDMEHCVLNYGMNGIVGNRALSLEAVVGTASLDQVQEGCGGWVVEGGWNGAHFVYQWWLGEMVEFKRMEFICTFDCGMAPLDGRITPFMSL